MLVAYFFIAIFLRIISGTITEETIKKKGIRKLLKLDAKKNRIFETGIELQNENFIRIMK